LQLLSWDYPANRSTNRPTREASRPAILLLRVISLGARRLRGHERRAVGDLASSLSVARSFPAGLRFGQG